MQRSSIFVAERSVVGPCGPGFGVAGVFGVRVCGTAVAELESLRCERSWALVEELTVQNRWLREEGEELSDLLHPAIGRCADGGAKPLLVALRRAVFQGRMPTARVWSGDRSDTARAALPGQLAKRIDQWARERARAEALEARLPQMLADDVAARTEALRRTAARDAFRLGLVLGSPDLTEAVGGWLDDPQALVPRPRSVWQLAKYLARATAKPSPYASFTFSGLGGWSESDREPEEIRWHGVIELARPATLALWHGLADRTELRDRVRLRVNPSTRPGDGRGRLWFLGAADGEPVCGLPESKALRAVLDFVRTAPEPTIGALRAHLACDAADDAANERVGALVERLISVGLLETCRPFHDQSADPLGDLARWTGVQGATDWQRRLLELREALTGYPALDAAAHRAERLRRVRRLVGALLTELGRPADPAAASRQLILENAVLPQPQVVTLDPNAWQPVFDDLEQLRGFLSILDGSLPAKLTVAAFFRDRFGPHARIPVLELYRAYLAAGAPAAAPEAGEEVRELERLRRTAVAALYDRADHTQVDGSAGIASLDPQVLAEIAACWPGYVRPPESVCCYGQELPGADGPRLMLNLVRTGYGWSITRTEHLMDTAGMNVPHRLAAASASGVLPAECRVAFRSQLNQRTAAVPYAIDYPGGEGSDGEPLALPALSVSYDSSVGRLLLCDPSGQQVRPLALGMLVEHALPPALRFLIQVFGEPQTALQPGRQLYHAGWYGTGEGPRRRSRLQCGRIVLTRAGWRVPACDVPLPAKGEPKARYLLRLACWRDERGIPPRCFVRSAPNRVGNEQDALRKPVYLDFANWFLVQGLAHSLARLGSPDRPIVFEEVLPQLSDAPHYGRDSGQRVTEYVFELSAVRPT